MEEREEIKDVWDFVHNGTGITEAQKTDSANRNGKEDRIVGMQNHRGIRSCERRVTCQAGTPVITEIHMRLVLLNSKQILVLTL